MASTVLPGAQFGAAGKLFWLTPTDAFPIASNEIHEVPFPSTLATVDTVPSWVPYQGRLYGAGGWNDNVVFDEHFRINRQGLTAPTVVPTVALSAGPGITAEVICYLAFYDEKTDERSPLSVAAPTLSAANQKITWSSLPIPLDPRVTHIQLWRSVDGGLPRLVMSRQLGVGTIVEGYDLGDLGEADVDVFERAPRCKFNSIFHERLAQAGDDEHPDTVYLSLLGQPERWGGLTLQTKNGEPIIGLMEVRDRLLVFSAFRTFVVDGWTEDDLALNVVQPAIGTLSHRAPHLIDDLAIIPTHRGPYLSDGASWFPIYQDIETTWIREVRLNPDNYENSWSVHDPILHQYLLFAGDNHTDTYGANTYWGADYRTVVPVEGGNMGQPRWAYKTRGREDTCAAVLALPGARRKEVFTGSADGYIRQENVVLGVGSQADSDDDDTFRKSMVWRHGVDFFSDIGGDDRMGKRFVDLDVFAECETEFWTLICYAGDEWAERQLVPQYIKEEPPSYLSPWVAKTQHSFKPTYLVGRGLVVEGLVEAPHVVYYRGYQVFWLPGLASRGAETIVDPG